MLSFMNHDRAAFDDHPVDRQCLTMIESWI
jgi:hypothetical protein